MPKVVPSQIVEYIDSRFQGVRQQLIHDDNVFKCDRSWHASISTIIDLVDQLPSNLVTISGEEFIRFVEAVNELKGALSLWSSDHTIKMRHEIYKMHDGTKLNPLTIIRKELAKCPDQGFDDEATAKGCLVAKDFRNLIHPGASIRKKITCDRGAALKTVGGMENVIKELSQIMQ